MTKPKQKAFWLRVRRSVDWNYAGSWSSNVAVSAIPGKLRTDVCPKDIKRLFGELEPGLYRVPVGKPEKVK